MSDTKKSDTKKKEEALRYHSSGRPGKIQVVPTKPHSTQRDLALAYSPGVAEPCLEIQQQPEDAYKYTDKGNLVAVISNGTAVLGLGNIGAQASKPVMEGKGLLFKIFADIDVFDIEVDTTDTEQFIQTVKNISPTFGGINLEDIKAPEAFEIERRLVEELDIPVMHDDQHGTAVISGAALLNALEIVGKKIGQVKMVVNGAGAAAISCARIYMSLGVRPENILMCDSKGVLNTRREGLSAEKKTFVRDTPCDTLAQAIRGADVFVGLSKGGVLTPEMLLTMASDPIVFALANPNPEIEYAQAMQTRKDIIMATGRSDTPNQINNVLGFPYIFRGALDVRATKINEQMKIAAVHAIAALAHKNVPEQVLIAYNMKSLSFGRDYIIPKPFDGRLITAVAPAVARAAMESGVARHPITDWDKYVESLEERLNKQPKIVFVEANYLNVLRAAYIAREEGTAVPILLGDEKQIRELMADNQLEMDVEIINTRGEAAHPTVNRYARLYWEEHQRMGVSLYDAERLMERRDYFAAMMLHEGLADAMIAGYDKNHAGKTLESVIGIDPQEGVMSAVSVISTQRGPLFIADTLINEDPDEQQLCAITRQVADFVRSLGVDPRQDSLQMLWLAAYLMGLPPTGLYTLCWTHGQTSRQVADFVRSLGVDPRIALVANSDFGSRSTRAAAKMSRLSRYMRENYRDMVIDGEIQPDFALDDALLSERFPFSALAGREGANVLIFPDRDSANLSYKLLRGVNRDRVTIGPVLLGLKKAAHLVYAGASTEDILHMVYVAVVDAQHPGAKIVSR